MVIAVIDYASGNLHSIEKAVICAEKNNGCNRNIVVTSSPEIIQKASHVILPGVGAYGDCLAGIHAIDGMYEALLHHVCANKTPFLGICVGMQLLSTFGHENGMHQGFDWIEGDVVAIDDTSDSGVVYRVPHMGWNSLQIHKRSHRLFDGIEDNEHVYFVHSYHFIAKQPKQVVASVAYGKAMTAVIARDNIMGLQFHPEKSQATGLKIIGNFLKI